MEKRARSSSTYTKHKFGDKRENYLEDRLSQLPEQVLVSIVSLLTIKEAARTSVLSHRWKRLWTFTRSLNFDATKPLIDIGLKPKLLTNERTKYINWVNWMLESLDGSSFDAFRVCFDLDKGSSSDIDRWIMFAIEKRVQRIELNLKPIAGGVTDASMRYNFPPECYDHIKQPRGLGNIKSLTSLCLKYINVTGEVVEYFLANCPLLERLCIVASEQLLNLKVAGSSLPLKYLAISRCCSLGNIEISAPNLRSFKHFGNVAKLHVKNAPQLVELSVGGGCFESLTNVFCSLSSYLFQLETLKLNVGNKVQNEFAPVLELPKLKHLILRADAYGDASLLGWTSLIKASPFLHRFTLELISLGPWIEREIQKATEIEEATKCPHQCLKVVELIGFVGCTTDIELALYFLQNASMLEMIIINRSSPFSLGKRWKFRETKKRRAAKERAMQLNSSLPPGAKLVVI